jgi:glutamate--cysteine ligase
VRLRGWLELRFLDALPAPWWHVAVAVTTALLDDEEAAGLAEHACAPAADLWHQAARNGLEHPVLSLAAKECFAAAQEALARRNAPRATQDATAAFYDRYVARHRSPADDHLDAWARARGNDTRVSLDDPAAAEVAWT